MLSFGAPSGGHMMENRSIHGSDTHDSGEEAPSGPPDKPKRATSPKIGWVRRLVIRPLIYFGLLMAAVHYSGRFLAETSLFKIIAEQNISQTSGLFVSIGEMSADGRAGWKIRIDKLVVMDGAQPLIRADMAQVELDLSRMITGEIHLSGLRLKDAALNLVRDRNGRLNIGAVEDRAIMDEALNLKLERYLGSLGKVYLENCSLTWTDMMVSDQPGYQLGFHDINLKMDSGKPDRRKIVVALDAVSQSPKGMGNIHLDGELQNTSWPYGDLGFDGHVKVDNLDVGHYWPYLGRFLPFQRLNTIATLDSHIKISRDKGFSSRGVVSVTGLDLWYRDAYRQGLKARNISIDHEILIQGDSVQLKKAMIDAAPLMINLQGEGQKLLEKNPQFYVEMDMARVNISELRKYIPFKYLTGVQAGFIENNILEGEIGITGLTFDGDLKTLETLDRVESYQSLSGMMELFGLRFSLPGLKREFKGIDGEFILADNRLVFNDLTGRYGGSTLNNITGMVDRLHEWPTFEAEILADLDMEETREGLAVHIISPEFRQVFDHVEYMSGKVGLNLSVKGDTENLVDSFGAEGTMVFNDVGIKSTAISSPLVAMNGKVDLDLDKIVFPGLSWRVGSNTFAMTGKIMDVLERSPSFDLLIESKVNMEETAGYFNIRDDELNRLAGEAFVTTQLNGKFSDYIHTSQLDLTRLDFVYGNTLFKRPGMSAAAEVAGRGKVGEMARIEKVSLEMGRSVATMSGDITGYIRGAPVWLKITSDGVYLDDLDYYTDIFDNIDSAGYFSGEINLGRGGDGGTSSHGAVKMVDSTFKIKIFTSFFKECNGLFELVNNQVFLRNGVGKLGKGEFSISGSAEVRDRSVFTLHATTTALDLDDLFGGSSQMVMDRPGAEGVRINIGPPPGEKKERKFFDGYWEILISSDKGEIGPLTYRNLDTVIKYEEDTFTVFPFTFEGHGGKWSWEAEINDLRKSIDFKSKVNVRDVAMESLGNPEEEKLISGPVNVRGDVNGHGRTWDQIAKTLDGRMEVSAGAGVIKRFNLLGKIFSLLNVSQYFKLKLPDLSVEGLPFNGIQGSIDLAAGVAYTEDFIVDSEAIRLTAVGSHDIGEDKVDLMVGVMPFVTVDRVISSIPVLGDVIAGEDKSFVGYYFRAKGPLDDPEIESVSLEALASGVKGIFQRLMNLPVKMRENILDQESGETGK